MGTRPSDEAIRAIVRATPIERIDVSDPALFRDDTVGFYFERLRNEAPAHLGTSPRFGEFWSITRFADIMSVDSNHRAFSSDAYRGGIQVYDFPKGLERVNFLSMDPPRHDEQRKVVSPIVAPANLARLESTIRANVDDILAGLPRGETFDWVDRVSIELTTRMLATLFDFPFEDRRLLTWWSEVFTMDLASGGPIDTEEKRVAELAACHDYCRRLLDERAKAPPRPDLLSMLAHSPATQAMTRKEFLGTMSLLIVGGNDTTRNSISGGLLALHENPDEYRKLRGNPGLVASLVPEIIRWQTPLAHMRRTTTEPVEIAGTRIPAGAKVVMWYLSGNRDERAIEEPNRFIIDRSRARQHLSFGFGIHRCVGNRLAEMQLRILWEEILRRFPPIEVVGPAQRTYSNFVHGITSMPVRIPS